MSSRRVSDTIRTLRILLDKAKDFSVFFRMTFGSDKLKLIGDVDLDFENFWPAEAMKLGLK